MRLTEAEHEKLCAEYTPPRTAKAIQLLDLHIGAKGKDEYKSHYHALRKWVFDAVKEREAKQQARASPGTDWKSPAQRRLEANMAACEEAKVLLFGNKGNLAQEIHCDATV